MEQIRRDVIRNVIKILNCLKEANDWMWIRQIARKTKLHHKTVSRLINTHLQIFVEEQTLEPFRIRMIRLKPDVNSEKVYKFFVLREKLKNNLI